MTPSSCQEARVAGHVPVNRNTEHMIELGPCDLLPALTLRVCAQRISPARLLPVVIVWIIGIVDELLNTENAKPFRLGQDQVAYRRE